MKTLNKLLLETYYMLQNLQLIDNMLYELLTHSKCPLRQVHNYLYFTSEKWEANKC